MPLPYILVLFNEPIHPPGHHDAESESEVVEVSEFVARTLAEAGFAVSRLGVSCDVGVLLSELEAHRPNAVFNLFEGIPGQEHSEAGLASLLDWQGIPYTGSPAQTLHLARNKPLTKTLLQGARLPTPAFEVVESIPLASRPRRWPQFVKPGLEDASIGIDQNSVVRGEEELAARVAYLLENHGPPVLVEDYIPGREFNVSVIESAESELHVMPLCEIRFDQGEGSSWPIMTYDAKWRPETHEFQATPRHFTTEIESRLAEDLSALSRQAFRLLGCRDYARVDFRVSPAGKPYIIEVNPNPSIHPEAGLPAAVVAGGLTHAGFIVQLARAALARARDHKKTVSDVQAQESIA
jgi:D-alanine-D-alanine ligase